VFLSVRVREYILFPLCFADFRIYPNLALLDPGFRTWVLDSGALIPLGYIVVVLFMLVIIPSYKYVPRYNPEVRQILREVLSPYLIRVYENFAGKIRI